MVFMTGGTFTGPARTFLTTIANPTIEKPFNKAALLAVIDAFVR
jgi:hypothetical protein